MVRFGCCITPDLIDLAAAAGYDYVELPVAIVLPERPELEFDPVRKALRQARVRLEAWELLLPPQLRVIGPEVDGPRLIRYLYTALRRVAELGGCVVGFRSAQARPSPEGFPVSEALGQMVEFLRICAMVARSRGLILALEPLSVTKCHLINSLPEAVALARTVNMPEVGVLPNALEMASDGHSPLDIVDAAEWLAHVHMPDGAISPASEFGGWAREFMDALLMADYDWRISIQADWHDPRAEMGAALASVRRCFEEVESSSYGALR